MADTTVDKLLQQARSNDVDSKVDAITKLQAEFEAGAEITDPDALLTVLRACVRHQNQLLSTATLSALPSLLPLLVSKPLVHGSALQSPATSTSSVAPTHIETATLRQVMIAFLPAGGVIDHLGNAREKARDAARQTVVALGGYAFRAGGSSSASMLAKSRDGKGPETPLMVFERLFRELGFGSKVWRVREQSMLSLVQIRRSHHLFPIKPYMSSLIDALEDSDANVRECAKTSVIELFTGPAVTDAARADLKKELAKKSVRKGISEAVLSGVAAGASVPATPAESESDVNSKKEYVPPSLALRKPVLGHSAGPSSRAVSTSSVPRPASRTGIQPPLPTPPAVPTPDTTSADVKIVYVASDKDLENEFAAMFKPFEGKETEHNWIDRERAILRVRGMIKGDVTSRFPDAFFTCLQQGFIAASLKALASLRTTMASHACMLYQELAVAWGTAIDPLCETLLTNLFAMSGFTKKIMAQQSQATVGVIIQNTSAHPRLFATLISRHMQEKNVQTRTYVVGHIKTFIEAHGIRSKASIEGTGAIDAIDASVKKGLHDPNVGVREVARGTFWAFEAIWPDRARTIMASLDAQNQKTLAKASPNPNSPTSAVPSLDASTAAAPKKSSVAAAIAASRAKARAIANAPPTLMHQATSHAQATNSTSKGGSPRSQSPSLSTHSSENGSIPRVASPVGRSPPRSRIGITPRSVSSGAVLSSSTSSPPSRTIQLNQTHHSPGLGSKRPASVLKLSPDRGTSTLRRAMATALPESPPATNLAISPPSNRPFRPVRNVANSPQTSIASVLAAPSKAQGRMSALLPEMASTLMSEFAGLIDDESMLLASKIPIPDSDSEMDIDETMQDISMTTPHPPRLAPPAQPIYIDRSMSNHSSSQGMSFSPKSDVSSSLQALPPATSFKRLASEPVVEDAMRARAEQAQSAAERLLEELDDSEVDGIQHSPIPPSLLPQNTSSVLDTSVSTTPKIKAKVTTGLSITPRLPTTPLSKSASILRQAALFADSPAQKSRSTSLMDMLHDHKHQSGWWLKRMSLIERGSPLRNTGSRDGRAELNTYINALETNNADQRTLQKLALLCTEFPLRDETSPMTSSGSFPTPISPSPTMPGSLNLQPLQNNIWTEGKAFSRLFNGLIKFLDPSKDELDLEYGLIVLWELLENQASCFDGREADVFSLLLSVRFCNKANVLEATNTLRDALASRIEPVYGLTTIHGSLRAFQAENLSPSQNIDVKTSSYAFGLIALGKFMLRLPAEILEDELPRLKVTLISALSNTASLVVRESAAACIVAAQLVLRNEAHVFELLEDLPDEKKNLLTYLFDKHGARGGADASPARLPASGVEKLEKEMRRLDGRTSTPPRPRVGSTAQG